MAANRFFDQPRKASLTIASVPQLGAQRPEQRHQNLSLDPRLVQERQFGINQIVVEYTYLSVSCG
jgi:hypothetical protein